MIKSNLENTESILYSSGDLVVLSFDKINSHNQNIEMHTLAVIDKISPYSLFVKISMNLSNQRIASFVSKLKKGFKFVYLKSPDMANSPIFLLCEIVPPNNGIIPKLVEEVSGKSWLLSTNTDESACPYSAE